MTIPQLQVRYGCAPFATALPDALPFHVLQEACGQWAVVRSGRAVIHLRLPAAAGFREDPKQRRTPAIEQCKDADALLRLPVVILCDGSWRWDPSVDVALRNPRLTGALGLGGNLKVDQRKIAI